MPALWHPCLTVPPHATDIEPFEADMGCSQARQTLLCTCRVMTADAGGVAPGLDGGLRILRGAVAGRPCAAIGVQKAFPASFRAKATTADV
jgi:hypothetical protein